MKTKGGVLIDNLLQVDDALLNKTYIDPATGCNYITRPGRMRGVNGKRKTWPLMSFLGKLVGVFRVLSGRGLVVYFKEDE